VAGNKSVRLFLLGDNSDAKIKIEAIDVKADELAAKHPELKIGIDSAAASEKLRVLRMELKEAGDAAVEADAKMNTHGKSGEKSAGMAEKAWGVAKYAILGIGAAMVVGVAKAAQFQQQMEHVHTQAGMSQASLKGLSDQVLTLAGQVGESPGSLAESLYHVASNMKSMGATGTQMMSAVKTAAEGAKVGGADLVDVTNALGAAIASGIPGVQNYQSAMGSLNATVGAGDMTMQNLAEAMGTGFLANVKIYGSTLNDVGAILATFGDNNIRGAHAGTQLRVSVQSIAVQAKTAAPVLAQLGLGINQLGRTQALHGTVAAVNLLHDRLVAAKIPANEWGAAITNLFGKKAGAGVAVLVDQVDRLNSKTKVLAQGAHTFGSAWHAQTQTVQQQFDNLKQGSDALLITLGIKLLPVALSVMKGINGFVQGLQHGSVAATGLASVIGVVLAGIALKKLEGGLTSAVQGFEGVWKGASKLGGLFMQLAAKLGIYTVAQEGETVATGEAEVATWGLNAAFLASPITWIVGGLLLIGIAIYELIKHSAAFRNFWKAAWKDVTAIISVAWDWVKQHWPLLLGILTGPIGAAAIFIISHWHAIVDGASQMFNAVVNFFKRIPGEIMSALGGLGSLLLSAGEALIGGFLNGITSKFDAVKHFIGGIASWISSHKGPIEFDRALLVPHGQAIMDGLSKGMKSRMPDLDRTLKAVTDKIADKMAKAMKAYDKNVFSSSVSGYDITSISGVNNKAVTAADIRKQLGLDLTQIHQFQNNIRKLAKEGLNRHLIRQLIAAGPITGGPAAAALAGASFSELRAISEEEADIYGASRSMSFTAGRAAHGLIEPWRHHRGHGHHHGRGGHHAAMEVEWVGGPAGDQEFITWLKKNIRIRGGDPSVLGR
jgi:TP901 family phage tail tape measure protein